MQQQIIDSLQKVGPEPNPRQIHSLILEYGITNFSKAFYSWLAERDAEKTKDHLWITVNPRDSVSIEELHTKIRKFAKKRWVKQSIYTFEQRGINKKSRGEGLHCHILVEMKTTKKRKNSYEIRRETYNTFKSLVGNTKHVCIKFIPNDWWQDKLDYLNGIKDDDDKQSKIEQDKIWRVQNNIEIIYSIVNNGNG